MCSHNKDVTKTVTILGNTIMTSKSKMSDYNGIKQFCQCPGIVLNNNHWNSKMICLCDVIISTTAVWFNTTLKIWVIRYGIIKLAQSNIYIKSQPSNSVYTTCTYGCHVTIITITLINSWFMTVLPLLSNPLNREQSPNETRFPLHHQGYVKPGAPQMRDMGGGGVW